jgi:glycerophosphoryl diester phosphodiesterase
MIRQLAFAALAMSLALSASATEIVAHRGASFDAPENTLAAFRLGWEQKADACELDIYLTKDGQIAVMHDATTKRTAGKDARVDQQTIEELRALDAGAWKGEKWKGEKIPMLSEVLSLIPEGQQLFIEVKCGPEILPELQRVIKASGKKASQLVIISFNFAVVEGARKAMPEIDAYFLAAYKADKKTGVIPTYAALLEKAKAANLTGLDLDFKYPLDATAIAQAKAVGLKIQVWTVDDPTVAKRLAEAGVQGITTNKPAMLRAALAAK